MAVSTPDTQPGYPKDVRAKEWFGKVSKEGVTPELARRVVGEFLTNGAKPSNYVDLGNNRLWNPGEIISGSSLRKLILPNIKPVIPNYYTKWSSEILKIGVQLMVTSNGGNDINSQVLCLVPYVRIAESGEVDYDTSEILVFTQRQVTDLRRILNI